MDVNRRSFGAVLASLTALSALPLPSHAQSAIRILRILVGYPAGGTTDAAARRLGEGLRDSYAQNVIVDNRPGAAGRIALTELSRAPADGSVMVVQPEAVLTLVPHVDPKNSPFRLSDVAPVSSCAVLRHALAIGPLVPAKVRTVRDFLDWAKANPSLANYGSPGSNTPQRFLMSSLSRDTGVALNHIPYKGSAPGIIDLIGGQVAAMCSPVGDSLPYLKDGKLRLLAVASENRSTLAPDTPTFQEQGFPGMMADETSGAVMPKGTPHEVLARAARAIAGAVRAPELVQAFARVGLEPSSMAPAEYSRVLDQNFVRWGEMVKASGFKPE
jgi:tripartite-type tricarboxylate transporter receptor subunit TctC